MRKLYGTEYLGGKALPAAVVAAFKSNNFICTDSAVFSKPQTNQKQIKKFLDLLYQFEKFDCEDILKEIGIPSDKINQSLLHAAENGDVKEIHHLLSEIKDYTYFDINEIKNSHGETMLMLAARQTRVKVPQMATHFQDSTLPKTCLSFSSSAAFFKKEKPNLAEEKAFNAVQFLLQEGADPLVTSNDGRTALMEAANSGHASVVNLLIDGVPLHKRIEHIKQFVDSKDSKDANTKKMDAYDIEIQKAMKKVLDERTEQTQAELSKNSNLKKL